MSDYSAIDKVLHRVILGAGFMGEMLFDMDSSMTGRAAVPVTRPVFVTGLARAGTTVLMRALYASGQFASLTYADMPMVMAPNLWAKFSGVGKKEREARERAHGDGVLVDFDAPEALEEVFWRSRHGPEYITPEVLVPHQISAETLTAYRRYQALICHRYGKSRYLAKNNNLMLRLAPLVQAMPDATFLVPVRDPAAQAASLLAQHQRFADADRFTTDYMRWLAHFEFGADQRPFRLPGQPPLRGTPDQPDYWLSLWCAVYGYLETIIQAYPDTVLPVLYEDLGADPQAWQRIARRLEIPADTDPGFRPAAPTSGAAYDPELLGHARALYQRLQTHIVQTAARDDTPEISTPSDF